jgi:hypothetical protein
MLDVDLESLDIVLREFPRDDFTIADQDDLDPEIASGENAAFHRSLWGQVTPHRVKRDSHCSFPAGRLFLDRREFPPAIGAAMTAHPVGHYRFAAVRAGAGVYRSQGIVRAALVFLGVRGTAFGCLH